MGGLAGIGFAVRAILTGTGLFLRAGWQGSQGKGWGFEWIELWIVGAIGGQLDLGLRQGQGRVVTNLSIKTIILPNITVIVRKTLVCRANVAVRLDNAN